MEAGALRFVAAGELWYQLHPGSLNLSQAGVQRYLLPEIWDPGVVTILLAPAALVLFVPGVLLMALAGRPRG